MNIHEERRVAAEIVVGAIIAVFIIALTAVFTAVIGATRDVRAMEVQYVRAN